ncbi:hypothetical protein ACWGR4_30655 [Embleya sp. NPDC055664]
MQFEVVDSVPVSGVAQKVAFLVPNDWDDWFRYETTYVLYVRFEGETHLIGQVKIGQFGMGQGLSSGVELSTEPLPGGGAPAARRPRLPRSFIRLGEDFFSLGQDDSYYLDLTELLGDDGRHEVLEALNDVALDPARFVRALEEPVTGTSLLRSVSQAAVEGQFHRLANGRARLTPYLLRYKPPTSPGGKAARISLDVVPESDPPTNIHVLIGRNGVGKTHLLNNMTLALVDSDSRPQDVGTFTRACIGL